MPRKDEIDRMIVMLYRSRNAGGHINFTRPAGWLDRLAMEGLEELQADFDRMSGEVAAEIELRKAEGIDRYSREWHETLKGREKLTGMLGVDFNSKY